MTKPRNDFKERCPNNSLYDLREDWGLIEASLATQYGIRIRNQGDMPWTEFCTLISGLMPDTPLGQVVAIRGEKDPKVIRAFSSGQKQIYSEWQKKQTRQLLNNPEELARDMESLSRMLNAMFGKKVEK